MKTRPIHWSWILIAALLVPGCDATPTATEGADLLDPALAGIVAEEGHALTFRTTLERGADEWRDQAAGRPDVRDLLSLASAMRVQAGSAAADGQPALAEVLQMEAETFLIRAGIALHGIGFAQEAAAETRRVVQRLRYVANAGRVSPEARARLDHADALSDLALSAGSMGDGVQAVLLSVEASETLAGLALDESARRWIGHAENLFERATSLAGQDPGPPVSAWLQAAGQMLSQAQSSYQSGNFQAAAQQAKASAQKSRKVIDALTGSSATGTAELAARAIAMAEELLERAEAAVGPQPAPQIRSALDEARRLLHEARTHFQAGGFTQAARLARESAALSAWVIRQHLGGPPAIDSAEAAERAIGQAQELLERATALAGANPRPEIADALARSQSKLAQARQAYDEGDYREAVRLARASSGVSSWVIRQLSS